MATPDLIKLAPTLSVEERYKIAIAECLRVMAGKPSVLSGSEIDAIASFEKTAAWELYALHIGMFKWVHILWIRDINAEKFSTCTCLLLLNHQLCRVILDGDEQMTKEARVEQLELLRKYVSILQEKLTDFYAYREALPRLKEELYGVPIFNEETETTIQGFYQFTDEMVVRHNTIVRDLCTEKSIKRYFKPIAQDMEFYLVKEPKPDEVAIAELVDEIKTWAESDVRARLGK